MIDRRIQAGVERGKCFEIEVDGNVRILLTSKAQGTGGVSVSKINNLQFEETIIVSPVTNDTIIITPEENFDNDFNYANLLFLLIPFAFLLVFFIILKKKSKRGKK